MPRTSASVDRTLAALADPTRRRVVDLLRLRPRPAGELASACRMSPPAMSRHLRVLRSKGLVEEEHTQPQDTRLRIYRLRRRPFTELQQWLQQVEAFWSDQLSAFKAQAENAAKGRTE
ncbi:MAG TPA: metalloregulator ArsR/SmtB family transcription factor [Bryobacteraceae bacterium]|nr:metalloregulator ArsR/SmtB family transcription factor [Bryobacteraceae bacterium]